MKTLMILLIVNILLLFINLLYGFSINLFWLGLILLLIIFLVAINKKTMPMLALGIPVIYYTLFAFPNNIVNLVFILFFIINYIYSFKYALNLINNKMNIQFKNLVIPINKDYLIIKYLYGYLDASNLNGIIVKEENYFKICIEQANGTIKENKIAFNDIDTIKVLEKPYLKETRVFTNTVSNPMYYTTSNPFREDLESAPTTKLITSYEITITLKDGKINKLISFNKPNMFNF